MKNLTAEDLQCLLASDRLDACGSAREWAKGKSLDEVWKTCHRGDWMLWLAARYGDVPLKTVVAITCDCAEPALAFTTDPRPAATIAVVRRWLKGVATLEEVEVAAEAAGAARAAEWAARAAEWAARAAAGAAAEAAARAAEWAAEWDAEWDAEAASLLFSADICRKYIEIDED